MPPDSGGRRSAKGAGFMVGSVAANPDNHRHRGQVFSDLADRFKSHIPSLRQVAPAEP